MSIYIPTYNRGVDRQVAWSYLPDHWRERTRFVVGNLKEYVEFSKVFGTEHVLQQPTMSRIPEARQWILEHAHSRYVLMLDDDLTFQFREDLGSTKLSTFPPQSVDSIDFMERMLHELLDWLMGGYIHVGISARAGNNHCPEPWRDNTRACTSHGIDTETVLALGGRYDRVALMEDFDMTLQLLTQGFPNRVMYWAAHQQTPNKTGGCSTYRTSGYQAEAAYHLAVLWPDYVTAVKRDSKWDGDMNEGRVDVRVQWQKAYKAGLTRAV